MLFFYKTLQYNAILENIRNYFFLKEKKESILLLCQLFIYKVFRILYIKGGYLHLRYLTNYNIRKNRVNLVETCLKTCFCALYFSIYLI